MHQLAHCPTHDDAQALEEDVFRPSFDGHRLTCGCFLTWSAETNQPQVLTPEEADEADARVGTFFANLNLVMGGR
jgi:hypothetical protein